MKSVNKILILFLFLISLSFIGIWEALQSEWMASRVSTIANKYVKEVLKSDINFEKLKFNLFPPAAELKNVRVFAEKKGVKTIIKLDILGLYFNPLDIFNTRFTIDNVLIADGSIEISKPQELKNSSNTKIKKPTLKKIMESFEINMLNELPINQLTLRDIKIKMNSTELQLRNLKGIKHTNKLKIIGQLENIEVKQWFDYTQRLDEVSFNISLTDYDVNIKKIILRNELASIKLSGSVSAYLSKNINYKLKAESSFPIEMLHDLLDFRPVGNVNSGNVLVHSDIEGEENEFKVTNSIKVKDFETDFIDGEKLDVIVSVDKHKIVFEKVIYESDLQRFNITKPFEFYDFKNKKFVEEEIVIAMNDVELGNALKYIRPQFKMLSGSVTGELRFELLKNSFKFYSENNVIVKSFKLSGNENLDIFEMNELNLSNTIFDINKGVFTMNVDGNINDTVINFNAKIGDGDFDLNMPTAFLDLDDFKHLLGYDVNGKGTFSFNINKNNKSEAIMKLKTDLKTFNFEGFQLDQVKGSSSINFTTSILNMTKVIAANGKASIVANGKINLKTKKIDAKYIIKKMSFSEMKKIMSPLLKGVALSSNEIHGDWSMKGTLGGTTTADGIDIRGDVYGVNNYFFDEGFDVIKCKFILENQTIKIKDFIGKKSKGKIYSYVEYKIQENELLYWMNINSIYLEDIFYFTKLPFKFRGVLGGKLSGRFENGKWSVNNNFELTETRVGNYRYGNSMINVNFTNSRINTNLNIFGNELVIKSNLILNENETSYVNLKLDVPNFKKFISVFKGISTENNALVGRIKYDLNSEFDFVRSKFSNIRSNLKEFKLLKYPVDINYKNKNAEVIVEKGNIKKWDLNIRNRGNYIKSKGEGNLNKQYDVKSKFKLHASLLEVFNPIVSKADGEIRGLIEYTKNGDVEDVKAIAKSNNLSLTTKYLPTSVTNSKLELSFEKNVLKIRKFIAKLVNGEFEASGDVNFSHIIPEVDIRYRFKDAGISILKKSTLEFSGTGSFIGKTFPYTLGGDFYIQKFSLINELTDLGGDGSNITKNDIEYLPINDSGINNQLVNFNINVLTREPMYISNSITDIGFVGNVHVLGGDKDIRLEGKVSLAPRKNIISFKNNVFELSKGNVFFTERKKIKNPELDFRASSSISNHQIFVELVGPLQNFKLNLLSEPALAQSDILSLIAFGYTEDLSSTLSDSEKESMTRAGVGSIIFDSFKINETLKSEFGLEVNLGTEISQNESSYLERSNSENSSGDGKVTSATKIELTKKVGDAMSLSIASTVGNNSQQKKSVNLNYNLNKNISVQGVYESRSDDTEKINNDTSFGTDVKWKWSFK
jgi:translocation and assembly module TamB